MDEEKKDEQTPEEEVEVDKPEATTSDADVGTSVKGSDSKKKENTLDRAERLNAEKAKLLEIEKGLIERKEKIMAHEMVGGRTLAGSLVEKKEETPQEYKDRVLQGKL